MSINPVKIIQTEWEGSYKLSELPQLMNEEIDYGI